MKSAEGVAKLSKHDREIDAIRKLIRTGMRLIVQIEQAQLRNDRQIAANSIQIAETQKEIRSLVKSLQGRNGHGKLSSS